MRGSASASGKSREHLEECARRIRILILQAVRGAGKGHIGGAFSIVEVLLALYHAHSMRHDPSNPAWEFRDRFILSKGHAGVALYATLADLGYFDLAHLEQLNRGQLLGEHPDPRAPGVEVVSGSLGHGLSVGAGMSLGFSITGQDCRTFVLLGDGECNEGSVWEAAMFAAHHRLTNLCAIVDRNGLITHGSTEEFNALEPFPEKWGSFGWEVIEVDGHDFESLLEVFERFRQNSFDRPLAVIANSTKGKGVSFMEDVAAWHHGGVSPEVFERAMREIRQEADHES